MLRFTPTYAHHIPSLESNYEYIRDTATVSIIDRDSNSWYCDLLHASLFLSAELEINFLDCDQIINEGSRTLTIPISLAFRLNQNPFTIILTPVTVDSAESMGLGPFINSQTIAQDSRAIAGIYLWDYNITFILFIV